MKKNTINRSTRPKLGTQNRTTSKSPQENLFNREVDGGRTEGISLEKSSSEDPATKV